ncbi:MAG: hypothetical protein R3C19_12340 [Planctomycetaceae bacterium]
MPPDFDGGTYLPSGTVSLPTANRRRPSPLTWRAIRTSSPPKARCPLDSRLAAEPDCNRRWSIIDDDAPAPVVWINELHYDNAGTDVGEFVEVAEQPALI